MSFSKKVLCPYCGAVGQATPRLVDGLWNTDKCPTAIATQNPARYKVVCAAAEANNW